MRRLARSLIVVALLVVLVGTGLTTPRPAGSGPSAVHADFCSACAPPDAEE